MAGAVNMALFDQPPPPAALSHTVVESSLRFSGYGGALRGSFTFFVCSDGLWWGYGGGLRPLRPGAVGGLAVAAGAVNTCEGLLTGPAEDACRSLSLLDTVSEGVGGQLADGGWVDDGLS